MRSSKMNRCLVIERHIRHPPADAWLRFARPQRSKITAKRPEPRGQLSERSIMHDAVRDVIAGSCAGMASTSTMYPMDTVRTRLQMFGHTKMFAGVRSCISQTIKHEGVLALYKGMALPLCSQLVFKSVIFSTNGYANRALAKRGLEGTAAGTFACGALSGGVNALFVSPVELVRTRLMLQFGRKPQGPSSLAGPVDCVRQVVRRHGVLGMWQGLRVTIARDGIGMGVFFLAFDNAKKAIMTHVYGVKDQPPPPFSVLLLAGTTAGFSFWAVALPLDTIKTVTQAVDRQRGEQVPGSMETCRSLLREGGVARLFRGWPVAFARGIPGAAIMLATHARVSRALDDVFPTMTMGVAEAPAACVLTPKRDAFNMMKKRTVRQEAR